MACQLAGCGYLSLLHINMNNMFTAPKMGAIMNTYQANDTTEQYLMSTFTLYRADAINESESGSIAVFDTTYYLDGDINNWDTKEEYVLPSGWDFVDGNGEASSYLVTDNNKVIEGQNICYSKSDDAPMTAYIGDNGRVTVIFKEINNA